MCALTPPLAEVAAAEVAEVVAAVTAAVVVVVVRAKTNTVQ